MEADIAGDMGEGQPTEAAAMEVDLLTGGVDMAAGLLTVVVRTRVIAAVHEESDKTPQVEYWIFASSRQLEYYNSWILNHSVIKILCDNVSIEMSIAVLKLLMCLLKRLLQSWCVCWNSWSIESWSV